MGVWECVWERGSVYGSVGVWERGGSVGVRESEGGTEEGEARFLR